MAIAQLVSKIDKVKVYSDGSSITRIADLPTIAWAENMESAEVEIAGLPLALEDSTVRVRIESGDTEVPLLVTDIRIGLTAPTPQDVQTEPLEDDIRTAKIEVDRLEHNLLALIHNEIAILQCLQLPDRPEGEDGKAPPTSPTGARLILESFKSEQLKLRVREMREVKAQLHDAQERLRELEHKQAIASSARTVKAHELRKTAIAKISYRKIDLQADGQAIAVASCQIVLEYFIPGAQWVPTYVCRLDSATNTASIAVRALICQRTNENWSSVRLELSTALPSIWCELPELPSLRLGRSQPAPRKLGWRSVPVGAEVLFEDYERQKQEAVEAIDFSSPYANLELPYFSQISAIQPPTIFPVAAAPKGDFEDLAMVGGSQFERFEAKQIQFESMATSDSSEYDSFAGRASNQMMESIPYPSSAPVPQPIMARRMAVSAPGADTTLGSSIAESSERSNEAIAYGLMRLGSPDEPDQRGKLAIADRTTTYLEILKRLDITIAFNIREILKRASQTAILCRSLRLPAKSANVRKQANSFDYAYVGEGRVDIPSDGQFHSVALIDRTADVDVRYVVVPREDVNVFRIAQLRNPLNAPLLCGAADIYVDGEYVLLTQIPTVPPKGQIELGLGVEQAIKVARNTSFTEVRSGETLVAFNELRHKIQIAIANRLDRAIAIEVRERIPIPQPEAKVDVAITHVSPAWEKYTQQERGEIVEGGYRWQIRIPANSSVDLEVNYTVKTFIDSELVGGNRREE